MVTNYRLKKVNNISSAAPEQTYDLNLIIPMSADVLAHVAPESMMPGQQQGSDSADYKVLRHDFSSSVFS